MTKWSSDSNEADRTGSEFDSTATLAIKLFLILIFAAGTLFAVLVTVELVFGIWSTIDQGLGTGTTKAK